MLQSTAFLIYAFKLFHLLPVGAAWGWLLSSLHTSPVDFGSFPAHWFDKMYQIYNSYRLVLTWNQTFLQGARVPFSEKCYFCNTVWMLEGARRVLVIASRPFLWTDLGTFQKVKYMINEYWYHHFKFRTTGFLSCIFLYCTYLLQSFSHSGNSGC